eukprot:3945183-Prymnesium_polylepis.2
MTAEVDMLPRTLFSFGVPGTVRAREGSPSMRKPSGESAATSARALRAPACTPEHSGMTAQHSPTCSNRTHAPTSVAST